MAFTVMLSVICASLRCTRLTAAYQPSLQIAPLRAVPNPWQKNYPAVLVGPQSECVQAVERTGLASHLTQTGRLHTCSDALLPACQRLHTTRRKQDLRLAMLVPSANTGRNLFACHSVHALHTWRTIKKDNVFRHPGTCDMS